MEATFFLTGASGYIGRHFISHLLKDIRPDEGFMQCDLKNGQDFSLLKGAKFKTVIHLAAHASVTQSLKDPDECLENNAFKLIPFLMNNQIEKFVFTSTGGAIYGNTRRAREEEASWNGCISPYGQSKYLAEKIIRQLQPNHTILRLGNVYGGNDSDRLELAAHARFRTDDPIVVYGGEQIRDFVHVDTVCSALLKAARSNIVGTFNLGSGEETLVRDVAENFSRSRGIPITYRPARTGEITEISLNVDKAKGVGLL